jgi:bacteriocin-like protein
MTKIQIADLAQVENQFDELSVLELESIIGGIIIIIIIIC